MFLNSAGVIENTFSKCRQKSVRFVKPTLSIISSIERSVSRSSRAASFTRRSRI